MKNYIIHLPDFDSSVAMATHALDTGTAQGWDLELYAGVDGRTVAGDAWNSTGITINQASAKCRDMMQLPGVRGCFLSHWNLWQHCVKTQQSIGIFEHDIEFVKSYQDLEFEHVLKLEGFSLKKPRPAGEWYEGARAYILKPAGAVRLLDWVQQNGAIPADVCIGLNVVDIVLQTDELVKVAQQASDKWHKHKQSFTWNLEQQE